MWSDSTPQLAVRNVERSQAWYRDVLGFDVDFTWGENDYGAVCEGDVRLYLCSFEDPAPSVVCITVDDPDGACARYREAGAKIVSDIEDKPWGVREFTLEDPDGNRFRIGRGIAD